MSKSDGEHTRVGLQLSRSRSNETAEQHESHRIERELSLGHERSCHNIMLLRM